MTNSPLTLYVNKDAVNRSSALVAHSGSSNLYPAKELNWVLGDLYDLNIVFLDRQGTTSSLDSGSAVRIGLGLPGESPLVLSDCGKLSDAIYTASFGPNTYEISASLNGATKRTYLLDIQTALGSFINSYQYPCTVNNQVVLNQLVHVTGSEFIISASYSAFALSSSYALSASFAPKQWNESGSNVFYTFRNVGIDGVPNNANLHIYAPVNGTPLLITDTGSLSNTFILQTVAGVPTITMYNGDGTIVSNFTAGGFSLGDGNTAGEVVIGTSGTSYINNTFNFGIGTNNPSARLHVQGNISASAVTASLEGTASWAITASYAKTASVAQQATSASYSINTLSASYAITSSNVSGQSVCNQYKFSSGFINSYSASFTASNADDGKFINLITGSLIYLTGSLSSTFSTVIYQSGSGTVTITGSDSSVVIRNRQSQKTIAGQYGVVSIVRLPNSDFVLSGDTA